MSGPISPEITNFGNMIVIYLEDYGISCIASVVTYVYRTGIRSYKTYWRAFSLKLVVYCVHIFHGGDYVQF